MGIELTHNSPDKTTLSEAGGAESGAPDAGDPDLLHVIRLWSSLPESVRRAVLAMIDAIADRER